jgi:adenylate cyclase
MVEANVDAQPLDDLQLKGFNHPVLAVEILRWREAGEQAAVEAPPAAAPRRRKQ